MQTVFINGSHRPFAVGVNQGDIFCKLAGLSLAQYAAIFADTSALGLGERRDFLYSALRAGAERQGLPVDFTTTDVGDWMDAPEYEAAENLTVVFTALAAQFAAKEEYRKQREAKNVSAPIAGPPKEVAPAS